VTALKGRILAIDYGSRRVGLAMTDPLQVLASGAGTIGNDGSVVAEVARRVKEEGVVLVLVGMPYAPDGGAGAKGAEILKFVEELRGVLEVPVETWDESFSSTRAQQVFREGGMKQKQRREKGRIDEMAARLFLQEYLETHDHRE
jgi:putative holliday junction resolvase